MNICYSLTPHGFALLQFKDRYAANCSIQESSLANEPAIWIGIDDADPKIRARDAAAYGVSNTETVGWVPYPIPDAVLLTTRMHLTQAQVAVLLPILQHFADTGNVEMQSEEPKYSAWRGGQGGDWEYLPASELTDFEREEYKLPPREAQVAGNMECRVVDAALHTEVSRGRLNRENPNDQMAELIANLPKPAWPEAPSVEAQIQQTVRELAAFCFGGPGTAGTITFGAAYTALVTALTAKDGMPRHKDTK